MRSRHCTGAPPLAQGRRREAAPPCAARLSAWNVTCIGLKTCGGGVLWRVTASHERRQLGGRFGRPRLVTVLRVTTKRRKLFRAISLFLQAARGAQTLSPRPAVLAIAPRHLKPCAELVSCTSSPGTSNRAGLLAQRWVERPPGFCPVQPAAACRRSASPAATSPARSSRLLRWPLVAENSSQAAGLRKWLDSLPA